MSDLYHETMSALEQSLHCGLIASSLDFDHGVMQVDVTEDQILRYALLNDFSRIPLYSTEHDGEKVVTDVAIVDLEGQCLETRRGLAVEEMIAVSTPISDAIQLLSRRHFYFVLEGSRIRRILTASDLNRLPVRTYLHAVLDHLEWCLAERVEATYPNDSWMSLLPDGSQNQIHRLHKKKRSQDFDTRLIHCTTLSHKATVVGKSREVLAALSFDSQSTFDSSFEDIRRLRNRVNHGLPPLDKEADTLRDHLCHGDLVTKRADLEWLQNTVGSMEQWIDALSSLGGSDEARRGRPGP